jgi:gas vesicle protein
MCTARFLGGLVIGGALGAFIGMLIAPRPGEETREMIREEFQDRVNTPVETAKNKATDLKDRALTKADELREKTQLIATELEEAGRGALERLKTKSRIGVTPEESPN